jgi:hypothetical protein
MSELKRAPLKGMALRPKGKAGTAPPEGTDDIGILGYWDIGHIELLYN